MSESLLYAEIIVDGIGTMFVNDGGRKEIVWVDGNNINGAPENKLELINKIMSELHSRIDPCVEQLQAEINAKGVVEWM